MAHFAQIDNNNIVQTVLVVSSNDAVSGQEFLYSLGLTGRWIQTSYNTYGGKHYVSDTITTVTTGSDGMLYYSTNSTPFSADGLSGLRYNYAGVGFYYDDVKDAFIPPQPPQYPSWILNPDTCLWIAPSAYPENGYFTTSTNLTAQTYYWDEPYINWLPMSGSPSLSAFYYQLINTWLFELLFYNRIIW